MINISTLVHDKKLSILLPNTNKVLAKVLSSATPEQLENITEQKDLKSILNSLLKDSSLNTKADKALLNLVKNNPTFKELSNANETIKNLTTILKSDKNLLHVDKMIQKFLPDIKELNNSNIKSTLANSGVFLESKLKDIKNPIVRLNTVLNELSSIIKDSKAPNVKTILHKINEINNSVPVKENLSSNVVQNQKEPVKALQNLAQNVKELNTQLDTQIKTANPITTEKFTAKLEKLESLIKETSPSTNSSSQVVPGNSDKNINSQVKLSNEISQAIQTQEKSTTVVKQDIKLPALMDSINEINTTLKRSFTPESKGFMDALTKIFNVLKNIEQSATTPQLASTLALEQEVPQKLDKILTQIKSDIKSADPLFSKEVKVILRELHTLNAPQKLSSQHNIKEILSNDLKAVVLNAREELAAQPTSATQTEALKQMDKLSMSIEYYQLVSHLSDSSSLYLPISWDEMNEGNISIKKLDKDKFYCDIELNLKEYKELRVRLTIFEKNQLNLHVSSDSSKLKKLMGESMSELRSALISMQITPRDIRFSNYTQNSAESSYKDIEQDFKMGFEIKA